MPRHPVQLAIPLSGLSVPRQPRLAWWHEWWVRHQCGVPCLFALERLDVEPASLRSQVGQYKHYGEAMRAIYAEAGLATFYTGYWTTVAREIPFSFIQFPIYEGLKKAWARRQGAETTPMQGAAEI